jgi:DNA-directed RNA polymerase subunit RPC12/RpoP
MKLTKGNLAVLLIALSKTSTDEVDCDYCQNHLATLAESKIAGVHIDKELLPVEKHIDLCADCSEELKLLIESILIALKAA